MKTFTAQLVVRGEDGCGMDYTDYINVYDDSGNYILQTEDLTEIVEATLKQNERFNCDEIVIQQENPYKREFFYSCLRKETIINSFK